MKTQPELKVNMNIDEISSLISEQVANEREQFQEEIDDSMYPKGPFPWHVLPNTISESLQQLARSCASSPTSLPGAAIAIFASVIGSKIAISPKQSWQVPLIFWFCDIRPSGSGKTPAARSLCSPLYTAQTESDNAYKREMELWEPLPKKSRGTQPARARGYFVTDLTLEGLRADHFAGHGGKVCFLDELSSFLSAQNQYKSGKGNDRESWLCLHDGNPARIIRAKESITLFGARISIFGGVQPSIWKRIFGEDGIYLTDGTIYRFLPTIEGDSFRPLTAESWSDENREGWESLLGAAMQWANNVDESKIIHLSEEAKTLFLDWRNELEQIKNDLPEQVKGFVPKLVGYALRFSGALYLMDVFSKGEEVRGLLSVDDVKKGITVSEFYLGHIIAAMKALVSNYEPEIEITEQAVHLAEVLESLRPDLDSGRLAVGYIQENFNKSCNNDLGIKSSRAMGAILRKFGLEVPAKRHNVNGKRGVYCLSWNDKTNNFIDQCSPSSPPSLAQGNQVVT
jgi:hypothetical protein